jgi:hypothetical protein
MSSSCDVEDVLDPVMTIKALSHQGQSRAQKGGMIANQSVDGLTRADSHSHTGID